jgi:hypothetical protein
LIVLKNAEYAYTHIQAYVCVLPGSVSAEAKALLSHDHAPFCHVPQGQKE